MDRGHKEEGSSFRWNSLNGVAREKGRRGLEEGN